MPSSPGDASDGSTASSERILPGAVPYRVKTDGSGYEEIPHPALIQGARIVSQFAITGARPQVIAVSFPDRPGSGPAVVCSSCS